MISRLAELDTTNHLIHQRHAPHVTLAKIGHAQSVVAREGLRRAAQFWLQAPARNWALFDAVQRNTSTPIKNVDLALFAGEDDGGDDAWLGGKVDQGRLRT